MSGTGPHHDAADFHSEDNSYLEKRTLRKGTAGWVLLAGLGVSYVISGDYAGWNNGLAEGGFGGLLIAAVVIAGMYLAMVLGMAEMSSALPPLVVGTRSPDVPGPVGWICHRHSNSHRVLDRAGSHRDVHRSYVESLNLFGITDGWWVYLAVYAIFIGIHLTGAGEALKAMFVITAIALVGLVVFAVSAVGLFDSSNLTDIAVDTDAAGSSSFLPFGCSESGRPCPSRSGSSLQSKAFRWPRRKHASRRRTFRAASSSAC